MVLKHLHLTTKIKNISIVFQNDNPLLCDIVAEYENGTKQNLVINLDYHNAVRLYVKIFYQLQEIKQSKGA